MNLDGLFAHTTVTFDPTYPQDSFTLNGEFQQGPSLKRVTEFLDIVRRLGRKNLWGHVTSENNFPTGAGIASSAAAFAALSLAAANAIGLRPSEAELSRLARRGSGSACRSVPGGFVEWLLGEKESESFAASIAPAEHWNLIDCITIVAAGHKAVGSTEGHALAASSPLQMARVADTPRRLEQCRQAIQSRDFDQLASVVELDSNLMHAVMMTSNPALFYWEPVSLALIKEIPAWRKSGLPVCYTLDAGPNVHILCPGESAAAVKSRLEAFPGVQTILAAKPGGAARLVERS
jgi:diphosphomevalonate decarboxylase